MDIQSNQLWTKAQPEQLARVLCGIEDMKSMRAFLRDAMTEKEILEISARLDAARMLSNGEKYTDIVSRTKLSSRTVARISDWLQNGCGGYQTAIEQLGRHTHTPPVRAG